MTDINDLLRNIAGISDEFLLNASTVTLANTLRELRHEARAAIEVAPVKHVLTKIQLKVLELTLQGNTNRQIGDVMRRSEKTIKAHMTRIFRITHCRNRSHLIASYYQAREVPHAR
jgi:DNA-binding CsgD family transcriptional regulator